MAESRRNTHGDGVWIRRDAKQYYEKPLWRCSDDGDSLHDEADYHESKDFRSGYGVVDSEEVRNLHTAMTVDLWIVELHGNMLFTQLNRADEEMD